jgi:threonine aldolase
MITIDLRSDTVTQPTQPMLDAMTAAPLGDDVLGDDPTVHRLQAHVAQLLGKEAACFVPTGTMANQAAIRAHTQPGDEVITHQDNHIIHYETGAPAALSGVMIRPLQGERGQFDPDDVRAAIRPVESHFAHSRLLILENTHNRGGGSVWPIDRLAAVCELGRELGLGLHLDGARLWNACTASGISPAQYAAHFDSVSVCFSKGLGCPAGSAVVGDAAFITRVHRFRKMFGGAMRQAGVLAAAAIYALDCNRDRLDQDHANAQLLTKELSRCSSLDVDTARTETNMVFFKTKDRTADTLCAQLEENGVRMLAESPQVVRAVTHLGVTRAMIEEAATRVRSVCS